MTTVLPFVPHQQQLVNLPPGFTAEQTSALLAANAGSPLVLVQPGAVTEPAGGAHRDFWLGLISVLKTVGDAALPIVLSPLLGSAAARLLDMGVDKAEALITGTPTKERWTLDDMRAEQASIKDPVT